MKILVVLIVIIASINTFANSRLKKGIKLFKWKDKYERQNIFQLECLERNENNKLEISDNYDNCEEYRPSKVTFNSSTSEPKLTYAAIIKFKFYPPSVSYKDGCVNMITPAFRATEPYKKKYIETELLLSNESGSIRERVRMKFEGEDLQEMIDLCIARLNETDPRSTIQTHDLYYSRPAIKAHQLEDLFNSQLERLKHANNLSNIHNEYLFRATNKTVDNLCGFGFCHPVLLVGLPIGFAIDVVRAPITIPRLASKRIIYRSKRKKLKRKFRNIMDDNLSNEIVLELSPFEGEMLSIQGDTYID